MGPAVSLGRRLAPVLARLREPSTWAAVGVLAVLAGRPLPADLVQAAPDLVALLAAGLGITLKEGDKS